LKINGAGDTGLFRDTLPDFTILGGKAIFQGTDTSGHRNLWVTDGTATGTIELTVNGTSSSGLLADADESPAAPYFTVLGSKAFFTGTDETNHNGLWVTDGTSAGTSKLGGVDLFSFIIDPHFTAIGSKMVFLGTDANDHDNLWVTNGTSAGTSELPVANAYSGGVLAFDDDYNVDFLTIGSKAVFKGADASGHAGLWVTDGTAAGTSELTVALVL
jgi:hypothetical protein